jgi:N-acetylglucosamine-6-phosphate deacetylase
MKLKVVLCLLSIFSACAPEPSDVKVIVGATLVDSSGKHAMDHAVIVVEGSTIRAVGPQATVPIPAGSQKIDGAGKTVAPREGDGVIAAGNAANLVLMSDGKVERTMVNGEWADSK